MRYESLFTLSSVASTVKRGDKNSFFYTVCKYKMKKKEIRLRDTVFLFTYHKGKSSKV